MTNLTINDIPDKRAKGCKEIVSLVISFEAKQYLKSLKDAGKDPQEFVRMLIADFMKRNPLDPAA